MGWLAWQRARTTTERPCTRDAVAAPVPLERRVALLVGGIGSTSERAAFGLVKGYHAMCGGLGLQPPVVMFSALVGCEGV